MAGLLANKHKLENPQEFLDFVDTQLRPRIVAKGEALNTSYLTAVRDFKEWLAPLWCELSNAFASRGGIEAPHPFFFKQRKDLTYHEAKRVQMPTANKNPQSVPAALCPGSNTDVFCCVKAYMRDTQLQQYPVYCLPSVRLGRVRSPAPQTVAERKPLTKENIKDWAALATWCETPGAQMPKAAKALRDFIGDVVWTCPPLTWLTEVHREDSRAMETGNVFFPHLPRSSWRLLSTFS